MIEAAERFSKWIADFSDRLGQLAKWVVLFIIVAITYDVFMRYALNAPTVWSWATSQMAGACFISLGLAYTYHVGANVRVDVIYQRFSLRTRLTIDVVFTVLFFFPLFFILTKLFWQDAWFAISIGQTDDSSVWGPLTWPYKTIVAFGFLVFLLQGVGTFLENVLALAKEGKKS